MGAKKTDKAASKAPKPTVAKPTKVGSGGKAKKKKWSKGKVRDKLNNLTLFAKPTYDKLHKEVPSYKLSHPLSTLRGSRSADPWPSKALRELQAKGWIRLVSKDSSQLIYTRATKGDKDDAPDS